MKPIPLINPRMIWACPASEQTRLHIDTQHPAFKAGMSPPNEGDLITVPFIQDPTTRQPVPVHVLQVQRKTGDQGHLLVVAVARANQAH